MLGTRGIASGGPAAGIFLVDELFDGEGFARCVTPKFHAHFAVQPLGTTFGQAIGEGLDENLAEGVGMLERGGVIFDLLASRDGERPKVVALVARYEIRQ